MKGNQTIRAKTTTQRVYLDYIRYIIVARAQKTSIHSPPFASACNRTGPILWVAPGTTFFHAIRAHRQAYLVDARDAYGRHGDPQDDDEEREEDVRTFAISNGPVEVRRRRELFMHAGHTCPSCLAPSTAG